MSARFFNQVKKHFQYLIDQYGFSVVREQRFPHFDYAEVVFQSQECRISVFREKGVILVFISPPAPLEEHWVDLGTVITYLSHGTDDSWNFRIPDLEYNARVEWQLATLSRILRPYCAQLGDLFRPENFAQKKSELQALRDKM